MHTEHTDWIKFSDDMYYRRSLLFFSSGPCRFFRFCDQNERQTIVKLR